MKYLFNAFSIFILTIGFVNAGQNDSKQDTPTAEKALPISSFDSANKIQQLVDSVWQNRNNQTDQAIKDADEALILLEQFPNPKLEAKVLHSVAWALMRKGQYEKSNSKAEKSLLIARENQDLEAQGYALNVLGSVEWFKGNFLSALDYFLNALDIRIEIGDKLNIARSYNNIGSVYQEIEDFEQSKRYHLRSLKLMQELDYSYGVATSYFNIGIVNQRLKNESEEEIYLNKALAAFIELDDSAALAEVQLNLGHLKLKQNQLHEASSLFDASKAGAILLDNQSILCRALLGQALIAYEKSEFTNALATALSSLKIAQSLDEKMQLRDIYELLGNTYRKLEKFEQALNAFEKHHEAKDAILKHVYEGNLSLLQQKFNAQQNKARIEYLEKEKALSDLRTFQAKKDSTYLTYGIMLITFFIAIIIYQYYKLLKRSRLTYLSAITDNLCGCFNRNYLFSDLIPKLIAKQEKIYTLLIDLDNFKSVNDEFGHDIGDKLLSAFSQRLLSIISDDSYLIRLGGEEFVVIGLQASEAELLQFANHVKTAIANQSFELTDSISLNITCSIGVSLGYAKSENELIALIKSSDQAMYQAKKAGRNKVVDSFRQAPVSA